MLALILSAYAGPIGGSVDLFTSWPTDVGLRGTLEVPGRVRFVASAGLLPDVYLQQINDIATQSGWYQEKDATLIEAALQRALVLRGHVGWRPFPKAGFQFELGYSWMGLGGGVTASDILYAETGYDLSEYIGDALPFEAHAALHRLELSLGWEQVIKKHLLLRLDLGASYTFDAQAQIEHQFDVPFFLEDPLADVEQKGEDDLVQIFKKYVHTPIVALGVGWRF